MPTVPLLTPVLAEMWLAVFGMAALIFGVFRGNRSTRLVAWVTVAAFAGAFAAVVGPASRTTSAMGGLFVVDGFAIYMKILVLIGATLTLILSLGFIRRENMERFEFPILILFATLGMMMMVSANDLIALYMGIELQSLALYVIAAFRRDSLRSTEAGLKYFVLGALASGMLLYGCSLIYGFTGTTRFDVLATLFSDGHGASTGVIVGLVFLIAGLAFKVSAPSTNPPGPVPTIASSAPRAPLITWPCGP